TPARALRTLLDLCARYMPPADLAQVSRAYTLAADAHAGVCRKSGEPYILHPLAVATTLAELALDAQGIAAALLHDTVEDTALTPEEVEREFGPVVLRIVDGVTKFTETEETPQASGPAAGAALISLEERTRRKKLERSATMRKLLLAMRDDPRVVLLKIADRLHNLRTLASMNAVQRERSARETLELYGPLAGRIGLYAVKNELEDLAFSHIEPPTFERISRRLDDELMKRRGWAERLRRRLELELARHGLVATVNWRVKHPYRAYREANEHGTDVALLNDLLAFRVLLATPDDCYRALAVIHALWRPHRYRDYIATPKTNGYQSFHTVVFALEGRLAQIHIRTHEMHRAAQHGIAAFWLERAARGEHIDGSSPKRMRELVGWVAQITKLDEELGADPVALVAAVQGDLFQEQIFVHTPKGDVLDLAEGSTVLDLAYKIHTDIGDHTVGAFVQSSDGYGTLRGRDVPLDHELQSGDIVQVLTAKDAHPEVAWLDIARTRYAREKIARALRLLQRTAVARGAEQPATAVPDDLRPRLLLHPSGGPARVVLARCCCPCPGDPLGGLAGRGRLVTVHRRCCRVLRAALARRQAPPLSVTWPQIGVKWYTAALLISGQDHRGLMHELSVCAMQLGLNVASSKASANQARYKAAVALTLDIPTNVRLEYVVGRLRRVPGIVSVWRDTRKGCDENP
ncbi:MAG TPA: HD domain-containing protein, partial [Ktedonobacterales bacterium]|nr:HD domain-containing protein [Ktedonobacterales bacterium]